MTNMFSKLDGYDWLGYTFSGAIFLIALLFVFGIQNGDIFLYLNKISELGLLEGLLFFLFTYYMGHLIQGVFIFFEKCFPKIRDEDLKIFNKNQLKSIGKELPKDTPYRVKNAYRYLLALQTSNAEHINKFNTLHYFYKGLFSTSFFLSVIIILVIVFDYICEVSDAKMIYLWLMFIFFFISMLIFYHRTMKFYGYLSEKICTSYEIIKKEKNV